MITFKLSALIENYQQDIADYNNLYEIMLELQKCLPDNPVEELHPAKPNDVEEAKQDNGEVETEYVKQLNRYMNRRDQQFKLIQERAQNSADLFKEISEMLGMELNLSNLKKKNIDPVLIQKLDEVLSNLTTVMEKVIELDKQITEKLKKDFEATKLQIQRINSSRKVKNAYQKDQQLEAYFIDKSN